MGRHRERHQLAVRPRWAAGALAALLVVALLALLSFTLSSCSNALSAATTVSVTDGWGVRDYYDWNYEDNTEEQDPYNELLEDLLSEQTTYA